MAPAALMAAIPGLTKEASTLIGDLMSKAREEIVVIGFDDDLDIVKPDDPSCVFKVRITPALIGTVAGTSLVLYVLWRWHTVGLKWDPFGLANWAGVMGDMGQGVKEKAQDMWGRLGL